MFSSWRNFQASLAVPLVCFLLVIINGGDSRRMRMNYRSNNSGNVWNNNGNGNGNSQNTYGVSQPLYGNTQENYGNQQGQGNSQQNINNNIDSQQGGYGNFQQDDGNGASNNYNHRPRYSEMEQTGIAMKKALGLTKIVLSPIVLPMIFFVGIVLLLFFAVVGSSAVVGGALNGRNKHYRPYRPEVFARKLSIGTAKLAENILASDECIERLSCELASKTQGSRAPKWITSALESIPQSKDNLIIGRISRSLMNTADCAIYNCSPASYLTKFYKLF